MFAGDRNFLAALCVLCASVCSVVVFLLPRPQAAQVSVYRWVEHLLGHPIPAFGFLHEQFEDAIDLGLVQCIGIVR